MTTRAEVYAAVRADSGIADTVQMMVDAGSNVPASSLYCLAVVAYLSGRISARRETIAVVDATLVIAKAE